MATMRFLIDKQMKRLTVILLSSLPLFTMEQVNYDKEPTNFSEKRYGPNNTHHVALAVRFGTMAPDGETASDMIYSNNIGLGVRYKRKLTNAIHLNGELSYDYMDYRFNAIHYVPGTGYVEEATQQNTGFRTIRVTRFIHNNLEVTPSVRFRFNRGQGIGWYVDLGAYAYYTFGGMYQMWGEHLQYGQTEVVSEVDPDNELGYGFMGRFAYNFIGLYYKYRAVQPMDEINLPPHTIGIELDINFNN